MTDQKTDNPTPARPGPGTFKAPKSSKSAPAAPTVRPGSSGPNWFMIAIVVLVVAGAGVIAWLATSRERLIDTEPTAAVELSGDTSDGEAGADFEPLTPMPEGLRITDPTTDPSAGQVAPTITGTSFTDEPVVIEPNGKPKVIYFLAHWCPHCQEEVPVVQELIDEGAVPEGLEIYAVSTAYRPEAGNHPHLWLDREGFTPVVVRDNDTSDALTAYGAGGFPYVVYLNAEHKVIARTSGSLGKDQIKNLWDLTVNS